jgi:hypothetical protein
MNSPWRETIKNAIKIRIKIVGRSFFARLALFWRRFFCVTSLGHVSYIVFSIYYVIYKGPLKNNKQKGPNTNQSTKQPTDSPSFFSFWRAMGYARRLWAWQPISCFLGTSSWLSVAAFLCELVPSDVPFIWCLFDNFFRASFQRHFFLFPPKNKLSSWRAL